MYGFYKIVLIVLTVISMVRAARYMFRGGNQPPNVASRVLRHEQDIPGSKILMKIMY